MRNKIVDIIELLANIINIFAFPVLVLCSYFTLTNSKQRKTKIGILFFFLTIIYAVLVCYFARQTFMRSPVYQKFVGGKK